MSKTLSKAALAVALALAAAGSAHAAFTSTQASTNPPDDILLIATDGTTTYIRDLNTAASTFATGSTQTFGITTSDLFASTFASDLSSVQWEVYGGYTVTDSNGFANSDAIYTSTTTTPKIGPDTSGNNDNLYITGLPGILGDGNVTLSKDGLSAIEANSLSEPTNLVFFGENNIGFNTTTNVGGTLNTVTTAEATNPNNGYTTVKFTVQPGTWTLSSTGVLTYTVPTVVTPVPEPGVWALMVASLLAVATMARRRTV